MWSNKPQREGDFRVDWRENQIDDEDSRGEFEHERFAAFERPRGGIGEKMVRQSESRLQRVRREIAERFDIDGNDAGDSHALDEKVARFLRLDGKKLKKEKKNDFYPR